MTALLFAETLSVEATPSSAVKNARLTEVPALQTDLQDVLLVQKASPWTLSKSRRLVDCMVAGAAIIISLPLLMLIWFLVRLTSPGPALFRQKRMGRNGVEFTLYKFRSMRDEDRLGCHITVSGDPRVTRVGSLLRRYKLDELPQFWNVLKGDMSLVGPRPKLPHHEALFMTARPGITGPATLAFRHEEELLVDVDESDLELFYEIAVKPTKARIDFEYMRNATCRSDLKVLWSTLASCIGYSKNAAPADWEHFMALISDQSYGGWIASTPRSWAR